MAEFGFPEIPQSFLVNQDLFYDQFNDIDFYVEDQYQENLYFRILKRFFPDIKISKILPLGGKEFVIQEAVNFIGNRKKVFIVDLDFDEILGLKIERENLFYLQAYSIENYLIEENAIIEFIKEQNPKVKNEEILGAFNLSEFKLECINLFSDIIKSFLVIQEYVLGMPNVSLGPSYFYKLSDSNPQINPITWPRHITSIDLKLKEIDPQNDFFYKMATYNEHFENLETAINNIPGKYLINFLKHRIESLFNIAKTNIESLTYRLSGHCSLNNLEFLQIGIHEYINGH